MMHWTTVGFCGFQWQSCIETWAPGTPRDISLKSHVHSYTCRSTFSNIFNLSYPAPFGHSFPLLMPNLNDEKMLPPTVIFGVSHEYAW